MTSLRVLHLIDSLGPGGAERSLVEFAGELRQRGHLPLVARFGDAAESIEGELLNAGVPAIRIGASGLPARVRAVRRLLRDHRPDVLHTTLFESDVAGRMAAVGTDVGVLTSLVNTSYEPVRLLDPRVRRTRLRGAQALDAATARLRGDHFHAISHTVADSAIRRLHLRPETLTVVPRGRRRERLGEPSADRRRKVRDRIGIPDDRFVLAHVGREDFQKGHGNLIRGFRAAQQRDPGLTLLLAGRRGNASSEVDRELGVGSEGILRLGYRADVGDLLAAADVFVFPSFYEGLGGAVIEAMAMNLPVIASDIPVLREVLGPSATFVDPGDPAALGAAILRASKHSHLIRAAGERNRERFEELFDFDSVMDRMVEVLSSTADRRSHS